jgi:hypothetical protein
MFTSSRSCVRFITSLLLQLMEHTWLSLDENQNNHKLVNYNVIKSVATPLWSSVGVKPNTPKVGDLESSGTPECLELDSRPKTPRIGVFLVSLESS